MMRVAAARLAFWGNGMEDERSYYARRAVEERSAAGKSANPRARDAHERMAQRYEEQALAAESSKGGAG